MKLITSGAEARIVETLSNFEDDTIESSKAVLFRFDQLLEHYKSDYQIKIAMNLLTDLLKRQDGEIYLYPDCSLVILGFDITKQLLDKAVFQLRYLFMDDPLAYKTDGHENEAFCQVFDLSESYDEFAAMCRKRMIESRRNEDEVQAKASPRLSSKPKNNSSVLSNSRQSPQATRYFDASNLDHLERQIRKINISPAIRQQPICATIPNMSVRKVFDELYINVAHLRQLLNTNVDLLSNRWLFKYLTLAMDERVIELTKQKSQTFLSNPISLNLNVRTLMSDVFLAFDAKLKPSSKVSVVIEVQASDVFEDMNAFMSARDSVQRLGYRICLDGLNHKSFCMIDREFLGVDLVKLQWNANIKSDIRNQENRTVANAVKRCGANRIILTRCDNRKAVDYGQALGISLFQGRYIDELIDPTSQTVN